MPDFLTASHREHKTPPDHFQVFGERRTGTNFLHHLVEQNNLLEPTTRYGWKHGFPTMPCIQSTALILIITREPLSWLSSLHNRPFATSHEKLEFSTFLRKEWRDDYHPKWFGHARWGYGGMRQEKGVLNQFDRHPITGAGFANPLELRRVRQAGLLGFLNRECNVAICDYDRLRKTPSDMIGEIADIFEIPVNAPITVPGRVGAEGHDRTRIHPEDMSGEDLSFIDQNLDHEQELRLGYPRVIG